MHFQKALIIAPHPDDEINLAGSVFAELTRRDIETFVLYTTNGNAERKIGNARLYQAIEALKLAGVDEKHIVFLGYANDWQSRHIYNAQPDEVCVSSIGTTATDSVPDHPEYCMQKTGSHHAFTRANFKADLAGAMREIRADVIICVDFDKHADHRAASLMTEEILGEWLREDAEYRPLVFEKLAYNGVWHGPKDYYQRPFVPTQKGPNLCYSGGVHDLETPCFRWADRLAFAVDPACRTKRIHRNLLYQMARKHRSTVAWWEVQRIANVDMVYWHRPTKNAMWDAQIAVSSGDSRYLNDFKMYDSADVRNIGQPFRGAGYAWTPQEDDEAKKITILLPEPQKLEAIVCYEDCEWDNHIESLEIVVNSGACTAVVECERDGSATRIALDGRAVSAITLQIQKASGCPGLSEVELLTCESDDPAHLFPPYEVLPPRLSVGRKSFSLRWNAPLTQHVFCSRSKFAMSGSGLSNHTSDKSVGKGEGHGYGAAEKAFVYCVWRGAL